MGSNSAGGLEGPNVFLLMATGEIRSATFAQHSNLYCKYAFVFGADWAVATGVEEGISQTCVRTATNQDFVFNFPLEATFKSTNPFGWPQLAITVYGADFLGRDVVRGYGAVHVPVTGGRHELRVNLFVPQDVTLLQRYLGYANGPWHPPGNVKAFLWFDRFGARSSVPDRWLFGKRPEYVDPTIVTRGMGREVTRVQSEGYVTVVLDVAFKDLARFGFRTA